MGGTGTVFADPVGETVRSRLRCAVHFDPIAVSSSYDHEDCTGAFGVFPVGAVISDAGRGERRVIG